MDDTIKRLIEQGWAVDHGGPSQAQKEGWDIFECDDSAHGRFQLCRVDEAGVFETDAAAWLHVYRQAKTSEYHRHALTFMAAVNPEEAVRIHRYAERAITAPVSDPDTITLTLPRFKVQAIEFALREAAAERRRDAEDGIGDDDHADREMAEDFEAVIPDILVALGKAEREMYRVSWEIDVVATSARNAAEQALEMQRDGNSLAVVFNVLDENGNSRRVDLLDVEDED